MLLLWVGCGKNDSSAPKPTPGPDPKPDPKPNEKRGLFLLSTDWSERTDGIELPSDYFVQIGDSLFTLQQVLQNYEVNMPEGHYPLYVYHFAEQIFIEGTVATVATATRGGVTIEAMPGWLFTGYADVTIEKNQRHPVHVVMQQQTRELIITLTPQGANANQIASIDATLSGVTQSWDFLQNKPVGNPAIIQPNFIKQEDGSWQAKVRLLGVLGEEQLLTTSFSFYSDMPRQSGIKSDLSSLLLNFNALPDAKVPFSLQAVIQKENHELGFTYTISDWEYAPPIDGIAQ